MTTSSRGLETTTTGTDTPLAAVILAAGEGTRMKSRRAKVLHEAAGRPIVEFVARAALAAGAAPIVVVVGVQGEEVKRRLSSALPEAPLFFVEQTERRGTADAVRRVRPALGDFPGDVLLLCGDVPALPAAALTELVARHRSTRSALTVLSAELDDPSGYGRLIRGPGGALQAIVEERDAGPEQRKIREINTGTYAARWPLLNAALDEIRADNAQNEFYLTDAVRLILARGEHAEAVIHPRPAEALGVNSRQQLSEVGRAINQAVLDRLMREGVTIVDPATTWIHDTVEIGQDTVIFPHVTLEGRTRIGSDCRIRPGARLTNVEVGDGAVLLENVIAADSVIGPESQVGPFTHLRPGTVIGAHCKLGNFVETKKSRFGNGSKASHLSYLGDATIGDGVNIGAGTITCNYDGTHKHPTVLEDGVFIGSDTQLVAPVRVGQGAYVAAGTTVTKDVPPGSLAIARIEQKNIEGWVEKRKNRQKG